MKTTTSLHLLTLALFVAVSTAEVDPRVDQYCFAGCQQALAGQNFAGRPNQVDDPYGASDCENALEVQSIYLCARAYCTARQVDVGRDYAIASCQDSGFSFPNLPDSQALTPDDIQRLPKLEYGDEPDQINTTIIPSEDLFDLGVRTTSWWYGGRIYHDRYSKAVFIFWGIVVGLGVCANLLTYIRNHLSAAGSMGAEELASNRQTSVIGRQWNQIRAHFLLPATFGKRCSVSPWYGTLPPRAETFIIAVHVILNVVLCAVSYDAFPRNLDFDRKATQIWRLFSDRTGYLSFANVLVFFLFGTRNNFLIWLTGWSFSTFNHFHRWVARIATLEAVLHSIGYTVFDFQDGGYADYIEDFARQYWWCGTISVIMMCFILAFSVRLVRVKSYDFFLVTHILLALITLVTLFYHVSQRFNGEYNYFLWPCVAFWAFDRVCRIGRVLYFLARAGMKKSLVTFSGDDEVIRVDVTGIFNNGKISGGSHFFIYSPFAIFGWQSHPFTLVRWKESEQSAVTKSSASGSGESSTEKTSADEAARETTKVPAGYVRYSFLIRPRSGFTARLRRSLNTDGSPTPLPLLYEGPYGHVPDLRRFAEILLLVGGSGISVGTSTIYKALEDNPHAMITLVWTCRRTKTYMDSIMSYELKAAFDTGRLNFDGFVTGHTDSIKGTSSKAIAHGRPDIPALVHEAATHRRGSLAVVVCGPASLADDAREAFVKELKGGRGDMELFMEAFHW